MLVRGWTSCLSRSAEAACPSQQPDNTAMHVAYSWTRYSMEGCCTQLLHADALVSLGVRSQHTVHVCGCGGATGGTLSRYKRMPHQLSDIISIQQYQSLHSWTSKAMRVGERDLSLSTGNSRVLQLGSKRLSKT